MGIKVVPKSKLQNQLEDKDYQQKAISKVESMKPAMKYGGKMKKAENGKSFPDLNKDGKITKADILKGRGVIAKNGMKMKKQAATAIAMKKTGKAPMMMKKGGMMKRGGMMKKGC